MTTFFALVALGVAAGVVTTWVGLGGGMAMTLVLSMVFGPATALAAAAPALWVGNAHRTYLFRKHVDRAALLSVGTAAVLGALLGGWLATGLPTDILRVLVVVATLTALVPKRSVTASAAGRFWSVPLGALAGLTTATAGAGAVFMVPAILSRGIDGARFVATISITSLLIHTGRMAGYTAGGWVDRKTLMMALTLGLSIIIGNVLGHWVRERTPDEVLSYALRAMTVALAVIAIASLS